jgi:hypothetical protein
MQERVRQLEAKLSVNEQQNFRDDVLDHGPNLPEVPSSRYQLGGPEQTRGGRGERVPGLAHGLGLVSASAAAEPHYFGFSAGLSLAHFVQVAIDSGSNSADVTSSARRPTPFQPSAECECNSS